MSNATTAEQTKIEIALHASIGALRAGLASGKLSPEETAAAKNALTSARIMLARVGGATLSEAMDAVLGAGTYERTARELHAGLLAKAAAGRVSL